MKKKELTSKLGDMYLMALENSSDEIFITDKKGVTIYCNKAFEEQYGYRVEEVIGTSNFFEDNDIFDFSPEQTTIKSGESTTIIRVTKAGKKLWITTKPVLDKHGKLKYIVGNSRDISKIEAMKDEIKHYKNQVDNYQFEIELLKKENRYNNNFDMLSNDSFKEIIKKIHKVSSKDTSILILGESGTGKSYFAKFIHENSLRKEKNFVTVDCASLHASLIESELFGYVDGAFTGSRKGGKIGLIEAASGGTLFLDEIGEMPVNVQAKLLRLIQEKEFIPVGGTEIKFANVRILAATNQNLSSMIEEKTFRSDLYYRLKIVEFELPPLRQRREDISLLSNYFIESLNKQYNSTNYFSKKCMKNMTSYEWKGNIRELKNVIEQMIIFAEYDEIKSSDLPGRILDYNDEVSALTDVSINVDDKSKNEKDIENQSDGVHIKGLKYRLEKLEQDIIVETYNKLRTSTAVAKELDISQSQAYRKMEKYIKR